MVFPLQEEERAYIAHERYLRLYVCVEELAATADTPAYVLAVCVLRACCGGDGTSANT